MVSGPRLHRGRSWGSEKNPTRGPLFSVFCRIAHTSNKSTHGIVAGELTELEHRSDALVPASARELEVTVHQRCQPSRNRQPETCSAIVPGGRAVDLVERSEDLAELVGRDADAAVANEEGHDLIVTVDADADRPPSRGELEGPA